jgi:hypothetical protein
MTTPEQRPDDPAGYDQSVPLGKLGFILSLVPWVAYVATAGLAVGGTPGFG